MSAIAKTKLKAARQALEKKEFEKAKNASLNVLDYEPENYLAHVFLGVAYLELNDAQQSEQMYIKAANIQPNQYTAFQGLMKLYDQNKQLDKYVETLEKLARLYLKSNDATKCAEMLQKHIEHQRNNGSATELVDALMLLLPDSAYYDLLSELPPPDATNPDATTTFLVQSTIHNSLPILEEIVSILEKHENDVFTKEVNNRRTRLKAPSLEAVKNEVGCEVWGSSRLPKLYQEIMSHPNASDDLRRSTEAKLLQHKQNLMYALTGENNAAQRQKLSEEIQELISGIVLLNIPNEPAWSMYIEGTNAASIEEYNFDILFRYIKLFPVSPLANLLSAYFLYAHITDKDSEGKESSAEGDSEEDYAKAIWKLAIDLPTSILANRIAAQVYQNEEDFKAAVTAAEKGLELVIREERSRVLMLPRVRLGLKVILGTALVHLFPPKHHTRALRIVDEVLAEDETNIECLMGRGFILQYAKRWDDARSVFLKVSDLLPDDVSDGLRAREEAAWCQAQAHDPDLASHELKDVVHILDPQEGRENDKARCWWRLGKCQWDLADNESREEAYKSFIASLQRYPNFAPAFTSLGFYYLEFASPPDPNRASKCFQKAFELDPREAEAARKLAEGFAEEHEWDLVEVVARRTIQGEGGVEGGLDTVATSRFQPLNAWAWKAIGIVELTRRRHAPAISAFQVALRSEPDDAVLWLRLGEAYSKAARLAPALKALERAHELDPTDWKCSYFLAEVHRQSGQYQEAIDKFTQILSETPSELSVLLSLAQTHLDRGRADKAAGFSARAEASFISAVCVILDGLDVSPGFRRIAWKIASDALYELCQLPLFVDTEALTSAVQRTIPLVITHPLERLSPLISVPPILKDASDKAISQFVLETVLCSYSYRLSLGSLDSTAAASASYDLGVALNLYSYHSKDSEIRENINKEAIRCFKDSIALDPLEDRYWVSLANSYFDSHPRLAQHAFTKALELDSKNFITWTSLGLFYLYHSDGELAKQSFNKAQVLDPDYSLAWVGQGVLAAAEGRNAEANALFEHAVGLTALVPEADFAFAKQSLDTINQGTARTRAPTRVETLLPAFFAIDRYSKQRPHDATGLHLLGLACEGIGHLDLAISTVEKAISLLEAEYEETEDAITERRFTIAHLNVARMRLAAGKYDEASESYQIAMGLLAEPDDTSGAALLAQAHLGLGLTQLCLGDATQAISSFEAASEVAVDDMQSRGHAQVLLAQTLWSLGTEDGQEAAKTQLLQSIDNDPDNLMAINTLAGMGILTDDDSLLDAALSEMLALSVDERQLRDPEGRVTYLLTQHHLAQGNTRKALSVAQKAVVHEPSSPRERAALTRLALQQGDIASAQVILGCSDIHLKDSFGLRALVEARNSLESATSHATSAVFRAPWDRSNWQVLAYCRSGSVQR